MKTLDLSEKPVQLAGPEQTKSVGYLFATYLMINHQVKSLQAIRVYDWCKSLLADKPIEMSDADLISLKEIVDSAESLSLLIKAPVLMKIEQLKD